jgi:hypothetical protein
MIDGMNSQKQRRRARTECLANRRRNKRRDLWFPCTVPGCDHEYNALELDESDDANQIVDDHFATHGFDEEWCEQIRAVFIEKIESDLNES